MMIDTLNQEYGFDVCCASGQQMMRRAIELCREMQVKYEDDAIALQTFEALERMCRQELIAE